MLRSGVRSVGWTPLGKSKTLLNLIRLLMLVAGAGVVLERSSNLSGLRIGSESCILTVAKGDLGMYRFVSVCSDNNIHYYFMIVLDESTKDKKTKALRYHAFLMVDIKVTDAV